MMILELSELKTWSLGSLWDLVESSRPWKYSDKAGSVPEFHLFFFFLDSIGPCWLMTTRRWILQSCVLERLVGVRSHKAWRLSGAGWDCAKELLYAHTIPQWVSQGGITGYVVRVTLKDFQPKLGHSTASSQLLWKCGSQFRDYFGITFSSTKTHVYALVDRIMYNFWLGLLVWGIIQMIQ